MRKKVKMQHPKTGHTRLFFEQSVPHHARAGWVLVREPAPVKRDNRDNKEGGK